ncbi:MAG: hypothetical protein HZC37_07810 [Burkholderiales bacterium]|nr:hypothetical protein [Burkholderiales bacterium]
MWTRTFFPLMQREWLQYRFGWTLLALIPLGLALLLVGVGRFEFDEGVAARPDVLPVMLALIPGAIGAVLMLLVALVTGIISATGLPRRDHGDRSQEFWLSLPVSHTAAFGVPLLAHLLLLPAAAVALGGVAGQLIGSLLVGRVAGLSALAEVPWGATLAATATLVLRLLAGLPLAVLWVLPLVLLVMLLNAWFKRWGWVVLVVGLGLMSLVDQLTLGQRWLLETMGRMLRRAAQSLMGAGGAGITIDRGAGVDTLLGLPAVAARDFGAAVAALGSPLFAGGLLFAAGCFALLTRWRQNSSGRGD